MSDKKIQFRKSMGGYNRDDVNSYIEQISIKHNESEIGYRKKIAELEQKVKELEEKSEQIDELSKKVEEGDNLIASLNETIEKVNNEKEELIKENAQLKAQAEESAKANDDSDVYEKSNKYDQVSGQIGELILNANAKAESIVSEAQIKARVNTRTMIENAASRLHKINEKYLGDITSKAVQLTEELRVVSLSADTFRTNMKSDIETEYNELKETIEQEKNIVLSGEEN